MKIDEYNRIKLDEEAMLCLNLSGGDTVSVCIVGQSLHILKKGTLLFFDSPYSQFYTAAEKSYIIMDGTGRIMLQDSIVDKLHLRGQELEISKNEYAVIVTKNEPSCVVCHKKKELSMIRDSIYLCESCANEIAMKYLHKKGTASLGV